MRAEDSPFGPHKRTSRCREKTEKPFGIAAARIRSETEWIQTKSRNTNRKNVENNAYQSIKTVTNLFVNLRCLQIKNNQALIYVGGGITKDSNPEKEWEETVAKSLTTKSLL